MTSRPRSERTSEPPLDSRKTSILGTIVYEYIATGEPVGSATLTQKYHLGISPATVRHEMAVLEEEGYLDQPHTSAGRVPSDRGYRYYVDRLMPVETLGEQERDAIYKEVRRAGKQLDTAVAQASHVLSNLARNIAFAIAPRLNSQSFRHIQLIWVAPKTVHIVLVSNLGLAGQATVQIDEDVDQEALTRASNYLNEHFSGLNLTDITAERLARELRLTPLPASLIRAVASLFAARQAEVERRLFTDGAQNLLDQQEFHDLRKLRAILELMEEQQTLYELLRQSLTTEGPQVSIGSELGNRDIVDLSVVTVPYKIGERNAGAVGILGPRRMHYSRLIALVNCMAEGLNAIFQGETPA
jgi:heat-inducible transcriptional repressor